MTGMRVWLCYLSVPALVFSSPPPFGTLSSRLKMRFGNRPFGLNPHCALLQVSAAVRVVPVEVFSATPEVMFEKSQLLAARRSPSVGYAWGVSDETGVPAPRS